MKIILRLTIVKFDGNGQKVSETKHIPLGDRLSFKDEDCVDSITINDVKFIYNKSDIEDDNDSIKV